MKWIVTTLIALLSVTCTPNATSIAGVYHGYFYETLHEMTLNADSTFVYKTEGHGESDPVSGGYSVKNDTIILGLDKPIPFGKYYLKIQSGCIINLEMHIDLCADTDMLATELLLLNYPQTESISPNQIYDLKMMLKQSLTHPELKGYLDRNTTVLIKEYFELNRSNHLNFKLNDKLLLFISAENVNAHKEYLVIEEIRIGVQTAFFNIRKNDEYGGSLTFFEKEEGKWKMQPRTPEKWR